MGRAYKITLIPGDGVGPEVISSAVRCIEAAGVKIEWDTQLAGQAALKKSYDPLPKVTIDSIKKYKVALKGPVTTPIGRGFRSVNVRLRKTFGLFAGVRPCRLFEGVPSGFEDVDITVIRENTEDVYSGIEFEAGAPKTKRLIAQIGADIPINSALSIKNISPVASKKIAEFAFWHAKKYQKSKVTVVHKANIMKHTDGLFLKAAERVSKRFPKIEFESLLVDNIAAQLVKNPERFDVLLCPNLYGDIISELCAALVGGVGLVPSVNHGKGHAIFEPMHGTAPKYAGKNKVNPTASILAGALLLRHLEEIDAAKRIERAVASVLKARKAVTYDLKPKRPAGTRQMTDAIVAKI